MLRPYTKLVLNLASSAALKTMADTAGTAAQCWSFGPQNLVLENWCGTVCLGNLFILVGAASQSHRCCCDIRPPYLARFPNVSAKGRGYQIRAMTEGPEGWEELRKVSVWQTAAALQQEMETKMIKAR